MDKEIEPNYYAILTCDVLYDENISASEKLLYASITSLSKKNGYCYASNKYLATLFNTTEITISRQINKLIENNFVKVDYEKKGNVIISRRILPLTKMLMAVNKNDNGTVNKNVKEINNSNNKNKSKYIYNDIYYRDNEELNKIFIDFLKQREKNKAVNSDRAINTLINKLSKYDDDTKYKMVEKSIINNWKDVYELKDNFNNKKDNDNNSGYHYELINGFNTLVRDK